MGRRHLAVSQRLSFQQVLLYLEHPHIIELALPCLHAPGTQWPGVGHLARGGGGARNPFGKVSRSPIGHTWWDVPQ